MLKKAYSKSLLLNLFILAAAIGYALIMGYLLFYRDRYFGHHYRYNLVPFDTVKRYMLHTDHINFEIWFKNIFGNIVLFIPIGIILPMLNISYRRVFALMFMTICIITTIELIQMITRVGSFDIDDIILNTLGALIGLGMVRMVFRKKMT